MKIKFILLTVTIIFSSAATADSLRCDGQLAKIGETKAEIIDKCGEPVMTDQYCEPLANAQPQGVQSGSNNVQNNIAINSCENVDIWTYNPGSGKFWTNLHFRRGELIFIRYGGRIK